MIKVLIVDDLRAMRIQLRAVLERQAGYEVTAEAEDAASGLAAYEECRPDVAIIDLVLPDESGQVLIRRILQMHPDARLVALSATQDAQTGPTAVRIGARAFVPKPIELGRLVQAVEAAVNGPPVESARPAGEAEPPAADEGGGEGGGEGEGEDADDIPAVLVVDDETVLQTLITRSVQKAGCRVAGVARSLAETNALLTSQHVDLVLLDVTLPDGDSLTWLRAARWRLTLPPVVIVTAHAERDFVRAALALGASGYLVKPVGMSDVINAIEKVRHQQIASGSRLAARKWARRG